MISAELRAVPMPPPPGTRSRAAAEHRTALREAVAARPGRLRRLRELRHHTPGRLQLIMSGLIALALTVGLTAGLTARATAAGTDDLGNRTQPLLIEAETIYTSLADADATAAQAFLAGGLEPRELTDQYDADLNQAAAALTSAARRTPGDGATADAIATLAAGMAEYAGLIATARANNRQGLPVGAAYLATASSLNRTSLQPQARNLQLAAQHALDDGYADARSVVWVSLLVLLLVAMLAALLATQRHLSRITRRTFNIPLVAATLVTAALALGAGAVLATQQAHLRAADTDGSTPIGLLAEARILTLQQRSDEALTLAGHGSADIYQQDFAAVDERLNRPDGLLARTAAAVHGEAREAVSGARASYLKYRAAHTAVRKLDDGGDYDGAVTLAIGEQTSTTFKAVKDGLGTALEDRKAAFDGEIHAAGRGLGVLLLLGPVLALLAGALAAAGIRARLQEYR